MTSSARQSLTVLLLLSVTHVVAEEPVADQLPQDGSSMAEAESDPSLIKKTSSSVITGAKKVRDTTVKVSTGAVERSSAWADQGKQGVGEAWSTTRDTTANLVDKTARGVESGVEYVRDGGARLVDKSAEVGGVVWKKTKQVSATAVEKSQAVIETIKTEIVGSDDPPAAVFDKSVPANP